MDMEVDDAPDELDRLKATSLFLRAVEACDALASDDALRSRMERLLDVIPSKLARRGLIEGRGHRYRTNGRT